jgi:DNA polymerase III sliding clamp (beta) subunit (PCNA family)
MIYKKGIKHLKRITDNARKLKGREITFGVAHEGSEVLASDAHRLLKLDIDRMNFEKHVLDLKTEDEIQLEYPDVNELFPEENEITIALSSKEVSEIKALLKSCKNIGMKFMTIAYHDDNWTIYPKENEESNETFTISYTFSQVEKNEIDKDYIKTKAFNVNYLLDVFDFLGATKKETKLQMCENRFKPILFKGEDYKYILCPVRIY